jgi:ribosome biogenesis protein BMS1
LIRSLVKLYSNHNLTTVTGPITVVTGKKKRLTFVECPNDTAAMVSSTWRLDSAQTRSSY